MLLDRDVLHRVRHLFDAEHLALVLDAVIAGNTPAQVWTDDSAAPRTALVWDGAHSVYLGGAEDRLPEWRELFVREIVPAAHGLVKAYVSDAFAAAVRSGGGSGATVLAGHRLQRRQRVLYRRPPGPIPALAQRLPAGFRISAIDDGYDELAALGNFADVRAEIESGWRSVDDFRRTGFGFVAHDATTIACWCTSECVSDGRCGIGIETVPAYGGRGFATLTASAFVDNCVNRDSTAYWDAWSTNRPSIAVAEKLGFGRVETYSIFVVDLG